ncbi:MAG: hypothetical protein LBH59_07110 [Planctomycetaceae bacterium]|nr:hypothetical protein [Planctomycetaceae bacterium]
MIFLNTKDTKDCCNRSRFFEKLDFAIPNPVWAVGFALEQTLHVVTLTVFSYVNFKVASA